MKTFSVRAALVVAFLCVIGSGASAQTNTPTVTLTRTVTPTYTPTNPVAVPTLTDKQVSQIRDFAPGAKWAAMAETLQAVARDTNDSVKVAVVPGIDGSGGGAQYAALFDHVGAVKAVFAVTTSSGAMATKALLAATTDYVVSADGKLEIASDQSANTLIVIYTR